MVVNSAIESAIVESTTSEDDASSGGEDSHSEDDDEQDDMRDDDAEHIRRPRRDTVDSLPAFVPGFTPSVDRSSSPGPGLDATQGTSQAGPQRDGSKNLKQVLRFDHNDGVPSAKQARSTKVLPITANDRDGGASESASVLSRSTVSTFHKVIENSHDYEEHSLTILRWLLMAVIAVVLALSMSTMTMARKTISDGMVSIMGTALEGERQHHETVS